jgi:hypothetical protein
MINPKLLKGLWCCLVIMISAKLLMAQSIERKIDISGFNAISVSSGINIYLSQSEEENVLIKGNADILDKITVRKTTSGILELKFENKASSMNWGWAKGDGVKAYISFKTLSKLIASGGSDIINQNNFKLDDFSIIASGGSDINLNLSVNHLTIVASGGSDIYLKGKTNKLNLTSSGGSDIKAYGLVVAEVMVVSSGGSDVELFVEKSIKAVASGASDIRYKGNPSNKSVKSSGASSVKEMN